MHDVIAMPVNDLVRFLLVAARVLGALATGPLFAFAGTPAAVRAGAGLAIALVLAPVVPASPPTELHLNLLVLVQEVVLGVLLGTLASLMVSALQMAAGLIDFQAGFSLGASIDSFSGHQVMPVERFYAALATLLFLELNGHHLFLLAFASLYQVVPVAAPLALAGPEAVVSLFQTVMVAAVLIALPVVGTLLLTDAVLALLTRAAPQFNLFVVGLPAKVGVALVAILLALPITVAGMETLFRHLPEALRTVVR